MGKQRWARQNCQCVEVGTPELWGCWIISESGCRVCKKGLCLEREVEEHLGSGSMTVIVLYWHDRRGCWRPFQGNYVLWTVIWHWNMNTENENSQKVVVEEVRRGKNCFRIGIRKRDFLPANTNLLTSTPTCFNFPPAPSSITSFSDECTNGVFRTRWINWR